ncbi:SigE family RNA polymerase sigma factor [Streptacidiphilus sp. EB103A]|uniref:SigE family RNA polymerase sigma factor n=1 Tax=Streptacidiphilus sp. EB103A TaxID=3156275 RepID=UPI0035116D45
MDVGRQARDAEFAEFAAGAYPSLLRTARLLTGDRHAAEDLVQAALVRVYVRWSRAASWEAPRAYARKTLVNLYATWRRRRWHTEVLKAEPAGQAGRDDTADQVVARHELGRALADLPRAQRVVLVLRFYEDLSVEQTADLLGCSTGTVKSRTSRALQHLRSTDALANYAGRTGR